MSNSTNTSSEAQQFTSLFSSIKNVEVIPWQENTKAVGVSILKDYPDKGAFIPARNKSGEKDSVAMIRIWYMRSDLVAEEQTTVKLYVGIYKSSRYLFKHPIFNFEKYEDSPTVSSLNESKASKQPVDLEEYSRYELHIYDKKIYDLKEKEYITSEKIVDEIYKVHLKTETNLAFQIKMKLQKRIIELIDPTIIVLKKINFYLFGKKIKQVDDFAVGIIKPYSFKDLGDFTLISEKPKILGSDFPISYKTAGTFIVFFSFVFIIKYYWHYDFLGLVTFINSITNSFFLAILTSAMVLFFDRAIPYIILLAINSLIKFRFSLTLLKIRV